MERTEGEELATLLDAARGGDERALSALLRALRPYVERYLRGRLQSNPASRALAEELTQEVLVQVASSVESCRASTRSGLRAWVKTIARRRTIDWYRRRSEELEQRIWTAADELPPEVWADVLLAPGDEAPGRASTPEVDRVLGRLVLEAQGALSEGTQVVVRRRLLYGDTWAEAGQAIGTTAGGAKRRWQRAQERLRTEVLDRVRQLPVRLRRDILQRLGKKG